MSDGGRPCLAVPCLTLLVLAVPAASESERERESGSEGAASERANEVVTRARAWWQLDKYEKDQLKQGSKFIGSELPMDRVGKEAPYGRLSAPTADNPEGTELVPPSLPPARALSINTTCTSPHTSRALVSASQGSRRRAGTVLCAAGVAAARARKGRGDRSRPRGRTRHRWPFPTLSGAHRSRAGMGATMRVARGAWLAVGEWRLTRVAFVGGVADRERAGHDAQRHPPRVPPPLSPLLRPRFAEPPPGARPPAPGVCCLPPPRPARVPSSPPDACELPFSGEMGVLCPGR